MNLSKGTLAIYGIQDLDNPGYPVFVHDHNMTFFYNGKIKKHIHTERLTRKKHDNSLPDNLYEILKSEQLLNDKRYDLIFVDNVIGRSFINSRGNIRLEAPLTDHISERSEPAKCFWLSKFREAHILNHELAHVYSNVPFYGPFKNNSLHIHFDGGASKSNFSVWLYKNQKLSIIQADWSLKHLSTLFNANALVFGMINAKRRDQNAVPGKFMGYSSYGKYHQEIEKWLEQNNYFESIWNNKTEFFVKVQEKFGYDKTSFDLHDPVLKNIAATIQKIFTREFLMVIQKLQEKTRTKYLYYTGGSALNIITNTELLKLNLFKNVFIPPCTNDSGLSIGAGAYLELEKNKNIKIHSPFLNNYNLQPYFWKYDEVIIEKIAELLIQNQVIGICNGHGEAGPRALGNRSIIALANNRKLSKKVSEYHKKREWYRPVAPVMLEKNVKYFTALEKINTLSRYMLIEFNILKNKIDEIEGVVHIDGTSRIQTIFSREDNPFMFDLLKYLDENNQIKAIINTSFNQKGEPIVHTLNDAIESAKKMKLDAVLTNGKLSILNK